MPKPQAAKNILKVSHVVEETLVDPGWNGWKVKILRQKTNNIESCFKVPPYLHLTKDSYR
jgi:hypothetical protein